MILFVCPPKFCISIVFVFSWDHCKSQEKLETMLMQNLGGGGGKQRVLWYFPKWPILVCSRTKGVARGGGGCPGVPVTPSL